LARRATDEAQSDNVQAALRFTPERIVAGITFHLIDEGIGTSVALESTRRTLSRLRQESFTLTISSRIWASLSNAQRLKRLLEREPHGAVASWRRDDCAGASVAVIGSQERMARHARRNLYY